MFVSKTIHADGTATIHITVAGIVHAVPIGEWSKMLATAPVIEETE